MGFMSPGTQVLLGFLILMYGILVGGTWMRRNTTKMWDTAQTIIFIVVAAIATIHLIIVGAKQAEAFRKAKDRLDCVAIQLDAIRAQVEMPVCDVRWDR